MSMFEAYEKHKNAGLEIIEKLEPGDTFHFCGSSNRQYKGHFLTTVDDDYVVYKWFGRHKQWWHYDVKHKQDLAFYIGKVMA